MFPFNSVSLNLKKMKSLVSKLFLGAFVFCSIISVNAQVTLHTIGDSTMATYDQSTSDIRGWGMMFQQFFTSGVTVNNRGKSGASSKSFYLEAPYWTTVKQQIKPGDYVIIQFAHNDEKNGGLDGGNDPNNPINGTDYRGTTAQGTYKDYLRKYIDETRALGATPLLATSMCRNYFKGTPTINRAGQHDLGDSFSVPTTDHTYDYAYAMREVGVEKNVKVIDLTSLTKALFESYGEAACTAQIFVATDGTHPTALGGTLVARLCAQNMYKQGILASYINTTTDVLINPTACVFGDAYTGQNVIQELTITGLDLLPASGTFSLSVTDGFQIAATKIDTFSPSIAMPYTSANLSFRTFYVSATQSVGGTKTGTLTVTNGTITKTIPLTANFIELTGGTEVSLIWDLSANDTYLLQGPAIAVDESLVGMSVNGYAAPSGTTTVWPTESGYITTRKTQRNEVTGGSWPAGEIDEVSTRYTQFGISASAGTELNIDLISMYIGGAGGSGMRCRIYYSLDDFVTSFVAGEFQSMAANTMYAVSKIPVLKLAFGQTLKIRVYPWYSSAATGKRICLSDVRIHGIALPANLSVNQFSENKIAWVVKDGLITIQNTPENSKITIYDLAGKMIYSKSSTTDTIQAPKTAGIYIGKVESEERTETTKFLVP